MKWETPKPKPKPGHHDCRIIPKFAFFPVKCNDGITVWLEKYWVEQRWDRRGRDIFDWILAGFKFEGWVDFDKSSMPMFKGQEYKKYFSIKL